MKAIAIYCVDGRLEGARARVREFLESEGYPIEQGSLYGLTKAGPDAACCGKRGDANQESIYSDIDLLLERGVDPQVIVLVSHTHCAGHPVPDAVHHEDTKRAGELLRARYSREVLCLIDERVTDHEWQLRKITTLN